MRNSDSFFFTTIAHIPESPIPLSEAILLGSMLKPQSKGAWGKMIQDRYTETCAILAGIDGAALLGVAEGELKKGHSIDVTDVFPILRVECACPVCGITDVTEAGAHASNDSKTLTAMIQHLNDDHKWPRPQIAEFVKTIEAKQVVLLPAPMVEAEVAV